MRLEKGFSILEVLLYIALLGLVALLTAPSIKQALLQRDRIASKENSKHKVEIIRAMLRDEADANVVIGGLRSVRIHHAGKITNGQGNLHSVHNAAPALRPNSQSDALTFLHLASEHRLYIFEITSVTSTEVAAKLCFLSGSSYAGVSQYQHVLAFGVDGVVELKARLAALSGSYAPCSGGKAFSGIFSVDPESMVEPLFTSSQLTTSELLQQIITIIPISSHYTVYVDSNNSLRRLSHSNTENQPLDYDFGFLKTQIIKSTSETEVTRVDIVRPTTTLSITSTTPEILGTLFISTPQSNALELFNLAF